MICSIRERRRQISIKSYHPHLGFSPISSAYVRDLTDRIVVVKLDAQIYIYCSVVRSLLEYACVVWHPGLSSKLSKDIERVQKRCFKIIYPKLSYSEALIKSSFVRLDTCHEEITRRTFRQVKCPIHPLHYMLPPTRFPLLR